MSLLPIRVDGAIQCQTALQLEQHALSYVDVTPPVASSEAVSLHSLVELLTAARNDSNRFLTSMIAKYPKGQHHIRHPSCRASVCAQSAQCVSLLHVLCGSCGQGQQAEEAE